MAAACLLAATAAGAHVDAPTVGSGGFLTGLMHPVTGLDHVVAMVAVGLWGGVLGMPALWLLPVVFPSSRLSVKVCPVTVFSGLPVLLMVPVTLF